MLTFIKVHTSRIKYMVMALLMAVPSLLMIAKVYASDMTQESVTISSSVAGAVVNHTYQLRITTAGNIGSLKFEYCTNSPFVGTACTVPAGLDVTGAALDSQSGVVGFIIDPLTNANSLVISRASAAVPASTLATYDFSNIINPSTDKQTVFVRITSYPTVDTSGPYTDVGAVVFRTTGQLTTSGFVPPYITFCAALTVTNRCTSAIGSVLDLGVMEHTNTSYGTTQFGVATNYPLGYVVYMSGTTLTSGNNTIPALTTPTVSKTGQSQFGMNLRANTVPSVGSNVSGLGTGLPAANYGIQNRYYFNSGAVIASSIKPTEFNTFTVSYIANVSNAQSAGVYNTTLLYTAVAQF